MSEVAETLVVEPLVTPPVVETPAAEVAPAAEPPKTEEVKAEPAKPEAWRQPLQQRFDQITREKYEAQRRAEAAEARARELEALAKPADPAAPARAFDPQEFQRAVERAADERARVKEFNDKCNRTYQLGKSEVGAEFDGAVQNLKLLGGDTVQYATFLDAVTELDGGHKIMAQLGSNLNEAQRIMSLPANKMALELAKLVYQTKAIPSVSQAPKPIKPINGGGNAATPGPDDNGNFRSQEDYRAWREKNRRKQ